MVLWYNLAVRRSFNPRSHAGSDSSIVSSYPTARACFNPRSHAGSDRPRWALARSFYRFNPRSHAGSDRIFCLESRQPVVFQSTLPRGERLLTMPMGTWQVGFNPRSHAGSDYIHRWIFYYRKRVSIHAPTRGATPWKNVVASPPSSFQSTLPRGERPSNQGSLYPAY